MYLHLKKQGVIDFTNVKELKYSALYVIEKSTHLNNGKNSGAADQRRGISPDT